MDSPISDVFLASAARFLIDGGQEDAASVLLSCSLWVEDDSEVSPYTGEQFSEIRVYLTAPRAAYDILVRDDHPITKACHRAFKALVPHGDTLKSISVRSELLEINPNWRNELLEIARGKGVHNQGLVMVEGRPIHTWKNLRFRSVSEVRMAQALERAGVLFLPNCLARLGSPQGRCNKEADFLICDGGRWGILEVDGEPFHPPSRTVEDHERDRLFQSYGILVVEHFDASECFENADGVVRKFLEILRKV